LHTRLAYQDDDDDDDDDDADDDDDFMARALKSGIRSEFFQSVRRTEARGAQVGARVSRIRRKREGRRRRRRRRMRRRSIGFLDGMSPVSHPKWRGASVRSTHTSGRSRNGGRPRSKLDAHHDRAAE